MLFLVRRHLWVLGVVCVLICGHFATEAASHILEARKQGEPVVLPPLPAGPPAAPPTARDKDGAALTARNMFCSNCEATPPGPPAPESTPIAPLAIDLLATHLGSPSFATLRNRDSGHQGAYWVGDRVPGAGTLERVGGTYIEIRRGDDGLDRIALGGAQAAARTPDPAPAPAAKIASAGPFADRIRKLGDDTFEVERGLLTELIANPRAAGSLRARPVMRDGEIQGFRIYGVSASSAAGAAGLANGDTLLAVNGLSPRTPDQMLSVYSKLQSESNIELSLERRGQPVTLRYRMRN